MSDKSMLLKRARAMAAAIMVTGSVASSASAQTTEDTGGIKKETIDNTATEKEVMDKCLNIVDKQISKTSDTAVLDVLKDMQLTINAAANQKEARILQTEFKNIYSDEVFMQELGTDYGYVEYSSIDNKERVAIGNRAYIENGEFMWRVKGGVEKVSEKNAQEVKTYMKNMRNNMGEGHTISFAQAMAMQQGGR